MDRVFSSQLSNRSLDCLPIRISDPGQ
jgi:hypothetical protein